MNKAESMVKNFGANLAESLGAGRSPISLAPTSTGPNRNDGVTRLKGAAQIDVDRIAPDPNQPRKEFDVEEIDRLGASLLSHGQIQPISVRWSDDMGMYLVVSGERRWQAAKKVGKARLDAVVIEGELTPSKILETQLVENALRVGLNPLEQAAAYRTLIEANGWTGARLAEALNLAPPSVTRALKLLELPEEVQGSVERGELSPATAYEVSKADPAEQVAMAARVVKDGLSRDDVVRQVKARPAKAAGKGRGPARARKVTERTFRTSDGVKLTLERRKGLDDAAIVAALREALALVEADGAEAAA